MRRGFVAAVLLCPAFLGAQGVHGTIIERTTQRPVAGAVVFLLGPTDTVVARDLTSETGRYRLVAPGAGTYRIRTLRIGFRPTISAPLQLRVNQSDSLTLVVENVPASLAAVRVESSTSCPAREDTRRAYSAWNEVVTALNAALLSSRLRGLAVTV